MDKYILQKRAKRCLGNNIFPIGAIGAYELHKLQHPKA